MYNYHDIKTVHLEITSKCNASCPMCLRNVSGGKVNPQLPITELSLADIKKIFPVSFIEQLGRIYMCGNYGDPMVAKDTLSVFTFFKNTNSNLRLEMFSNGSGKTTDWWKDLAKVVDTVHFSIDGLEDTNHIYRQNTNFKKIMENASAYILAGGKAIWDFIVFEHNEHQVEEAMALASKLGFYKFVVKKTGRFYSNQKSTVKTEQAVLDNKGNISYYLKSPKNKKYQNLSLQKEEALSKEHGSIHAYLNQTSIKCRVQQEQSLYISAEAFVFPCCWTANQLYPWYFKERSSQIWKIINTLPKKEQSISAKQTSIQKIIEGEFFQKLIPKTWQGTDINTNKLRVCAKTCGQKFTPFADQFLKS